MRQVLAVVVAVTLVAVAIVVRDALDDDGDADDGGSDDGDGELVVACVTELAEACEALDGAVLRIEDPADTIAAAAGVDAWVTFEPWAEMAAAQEARTVFDGSVAVAASALLVLARPEAVDASCGATAGWACLLDGGARVHAPPLDSALGPFVVADAGVELFGGRFATNDLRDDAEFRGRLERIRFEVADPVGEMLLPLGSAGPQATGTTQADLESRVRGTARGDALETFPTGRTVAVVVVGRDADEVGSDDDFLAALERLGWDLAPDAATTGLPDAGVLVALGQELA